MDKKDTFYWNEEKNRIDGFIPLDDGNAAPGSGAGQKQDPAQAYQNYLDESYGEYKDEQYGSPGYEPAFEEAADTRMPSYRPKKRKRRPPKMVTLGILCLCIVLAAVTGAVSAVAVMQHYAGQQTADNPVQIPEGTHAGIGAICETALEAGQTGHAGGTVTTETAAENSADPIPAAAADTNVIKNIMDSVVCIKTTATVDTFYGPMSANGAGSGVIISEDGYIVTCAHVISNASKIEVQDSEDRVYEASLVAASEKMDLALLKVDAAGLTPAVLGDSDTYTAGDQIYVVGNPLGNFVLSVSQGIISGVDRQANIDGNVMRLTQVDAAVNPGNSGGGLFDSSGRLIGIVNAKNTGIDVEGMGFAIPIDTVREVLERMLQRTNLVLN